VYKAVLLPPPKQNTKGTLPAASRAALGVAKAQSPSVDAVDEPLNNPELCMRPGDLPAKEGEVFAIKKFKPDKEGDQQTYAGISQSGAREIMVRPIEN
jgi:cyclin-dependent kinase 8/11